MKRLIRNLLEVAFIVVLSVFSLSVVAAARDKMVERGMNKDEVQTILGKPKAMSFDQDGETWTYSKIPVIGEFYKLIFVHFDLNGKVNTYQEQLFDNTTSDNTPPFGARRPAIVPGSSYAPNTPCPPYVQFGLSDSAFSFLLGKVRSASFDKDKYDLLEVASLGCYYTCDQCARVMELFSFDDDKLHVLKIMAPRIVDAQNAYIIYKVFTFDTDKEKAAQIMAGR